MSAQCKLTWPNYIHDIHQGAIPARLLVSRRCRCEKFVQFPNNMANCCLAGKGKSERVFPPTRILSAEAFYRTALDTGSEREMMMMWCRRGEKTVETFPKRRRRDKQRQQLCVLLFGMQETFLLRSPASRAAAAWKRRTHRPNYCQQPKPPPLFRLPQSVNQSFLSRRHMPISPCSSCAYYLITVECGEIFLFYVNRVFMGY
jgi:hypothetical protein